VSPTDSLPQRVLDLLHRVDRIAAPLCCALYPGSLNIHASAVGREYLIQGVRNLWAFEGLHFTKVVPDNVNRDHHQVLVDRIVMPALESLESLAAVINQPAVNSLNQVLGRVIGGLFSTIYFLPRFASKCFQNGGLYCSHVKTHKHLPSFLVDGADITPTQYQCWLRVLRYER